MNSFSSFLRLHQDEIPLMIGNIWDVHSAKVFERSGFKAVATSSAAVANTFGYEDGEHMPFILIERIAKRLVECIKLPVSVDIEGGYSRTPTGIFEAIKRLYDVGVVGINLEDSMPGADRKLQDVSKFQKVLSSLCELLLKSNVNVFLNIRTDSYLLGQPNALVETLARIAAYSETGIHGIFVPCITNAGDIQKVVSSTTLPINVMSMPELPSFATLKTLGVKRISMGNSLHRAVYNSMESQVQAIRDNENFNSLFHRNE